MNGLDGWTCPVPDCVQTGIDPFADRCPNGHPRHRTPPVEAPPVAAAAEVQTRPVGRTTVETNETRPVRVVVTVDGTEFVMDGPGLLIGRRSPHAPLAEYLAAHYPNVSRQHLTVTCYPTHVTVTDGSINGTYTDAGTRLPKGQPQDFDSPLRLRLARNCRIRLVLVPPVDPGQPSGAGP